MSDMERPITVNPRRAALVLGWIAGIVVVCSILSNVLMYATWYLDWAILLKFDLNLEGTLPSFFSAVLFFFLF